MRYIASLKLFSLLLLSLCSEGQAYHPFPTDSAYWKYYGHDNGYHFLDYVSYDLDGDSVFGGKTYSRIFKTTQSSNTITGTTDFAPPHFIGGLREQDKIIYFYDPYLLSEDTVFNFTLGVGDTVAHVYYIFSGWQWLTVSQIDSVPMLDGSFRRRFNFYPPLSDSYIEGIGSSYSIFPEYTPPFGPGAVFFQLTCFTDHDTLLYHESSNEDCSLITSVEQVMNVNNEMSTHPNPFSNEVSIEFGKIIHEGVLEIKNVSGQIVLKERISNSDLEIIPAEYFQANGIYFLTVKTEDKVYCSKLVCER